MNLKIRILLFATIFFGQLLKAQIDSTDFSLTAVADSTNSEYHELNLQFDYNVVSEYVQMTIELLLTNSESGEQLIYSENFEIAQLDESQYFSNGTILIHPGTGITGYNYCAVIRLLDSSGHQVVINENLPL